MIKKFILLVIILMAAASVSAQDVSVEAEIGKKQMALGESTRFTVTIQGSQSAEPPQVPVIDGLDVRYLGPSTQVSIVNGQYSSSVAHNYSVFPMKVGDFQIPALTIDADGKVLQTTPISVSVVASAAETSAGDSSSAFDLSSRMRVLIKPAKTEAFVQEAVPVKIFLMVAADVEVGDVYVPKFTTDGFEKSDFKHKRYFQVIDGVKFRIDELETLIYPQREGELTIGPAEVPFNIFVDAEDSDDPFSSRGTFFNDPFFSSFFNRRQSQTVSLKSDAAKLTVKPLPQEGRPADFNGAVGQFNFDMSVGPQEAEVGDPLTVKMSLAGTGLLADAELPAIKDSSDFKVYEPSRKSDQTSKSLEQVVIPLSDKIKEFPVVSFSWFDPSDGQYHTTRKGPFPLSIKPASQKTQAYAPSSSVPQPVVALDQPETLGEDIVFIKDEPGALRPIGSHLLGSKIFFIGIIGYAVLWLGVMMGLVFRRRLKTDPAFAERLKAGEDARKELAKLRSAMTNPSEFYDAAHKLLIRYFARKLQMPPGEVSAPAVTAHPQWKAPADINNRLNAIFSECESVRFASMNVSEGQIQETLKSMETIIRHSEKVIR